MVLQMLSPHSSVRQFKRITHGRKQTERLAS
jgi:hypothetical protein